MIGKNLIHEAFGAGARVPRRYRRRCKGPMTCRRATRRRARPLPMCRLQRARSLRMPMRSSSVRSTRFGNMCAQMRNFLGHTGGLSMSGGIRRQGGQRVHQYREPAWRAGDNDHELPQHAPAPGHDNRRCAVFGAAAGGHDRDHRGTPYGASTITAADGSRLPSKNELAIARFQGRHVTEIAARLMR